MRLESGFQIALNWLYIGKMIVASQLDVAVFLLSILVTGPSSMVLELWQFLFIRDWPEIRKTEMRPSGFYPISGYLKE